MGGKLSAEGWHGPLTGAWHGSCLWKVSSGNKQKKELNGSFCESCLVGPCAWIIVALTQGTESALPLSMTFRVLFLTAVQSES